MSDDDQEIDIESYEDDDSDSKQKQSNNTQYYSEAKKRAHHNALERKRRDHIKDNFFVLKNSIPTLQGRKVTSRTQVLKKAVEYIQLMQRRKSSHEQDIADLIRQNNLLQAQIDICKRSRQH